MIPRCVEVLRGTAPENNPRKITKPVALILLAHYLGDIHQPLHVGADYFDAFGNPVEPTDPNQPFFEDQGGNKLHLILAGRGTGGRNLHGFWDGNAVTAAFGPTPNTVIANQLASTEPANWKISGDVRTWSVKMAYEILPLSRRAHSRLRFSQVEFPSPDMPPVIVSVAATEIPGSTQALETYAVFAAKTVRDEMHKAGWRLADLVTRVRQ